MARRVPRGLFVTGTDTGVGKTQIAAALTRLLDERNLIVRPRKPVESGCRREGDRLVPEDARALQAAARTDETLERICPYPLEPPLSPERAAMLANMRLDLDDLKSACLEGVAETDFLLVEGAGGFYSPLASGVLNADLAAALPLPVLLVAADRLGAIGHTLLTIEAIKRRGLALVGVVLNRIDTGGDPRMDNATDLSRWLGHPVTVTGRFDASAAEPGGMMPCPALAPLADRLAISFQPRRRACNL
ncbi:dethiobiotin synthase [Methylococcus sp. Mc7]|uniref:dethiobiotin synthase n=1 Tax=Methylococcus sp. Mc7 TaxID=2860258 RepID=UPI001C52E113|nr:dethiobiotin synthase [Methylococcus sp. Mc7]QXP85725.1 dethiobiotin synthase [Methylococcus sp. Mc7]